MPEPSLALAALAERLHTDVDSVLPLDRLDEQTLTAFDALVAAAQARDEAAIEAGLQEALRFVPRLLRGRAAKMLFPEES